MTARNLLLWPRMRAVRLLLAAVLASILGGATMVAALAGFAAGALPSAVGSELGRSPHTSVSIYGGFGAAQARYDQPRVSATLRRAFGPIAFRADEATWSDPFSLPGQRRTAKTVSLVQAAAFTSIRDRIRLTAGTWPSASRPSQPVQALAPANVAADLHMKVGKPVMLRDRQSGAHTSFVLTGLYRPADQAAPYWGLNLIGAAGSSTSSGFITYGPLLVDQQAFRSGQLATDGATWLVAPAIRTIGISELQPLAGRVGRAVHHLAGSITLGGLQVSTGLPATFSGVATRLVVARSLLLVGEFELLLLAGAALTLTVRTLVSQREEETALLAARGAGRRQMIRLALGEALLIAIAGTGAGALIGIRAAAALAGSGQLRAA